MEKIIIYIENDTVSAFNVKKGEPIRPKGLDSMKLDSKESVSNFCKILRDKYNIDDFSEIDMTIYLVNEEANTEILAALREELQNAHKFYENTEENTIELAKKNDETIKELKTQVDKLKSLNDSLKSEKESLQKTITEYESELTSLREFKESVTKKAEEKLTKINEVREKREIEAQLIKADFIHDDQWDINNRFIPHADKDKVFFHKKFRDGETISAGSIIGIYDDIQSDNHALLLDLNTTFRQNGARMIKSKVSGRIYYLVEENETITHGSPIAMIGDFNSVEEAACYAEEHNLI